MSDRLTPVMQVTTASSQYPIYLGDGLLQKAPMLLAPYVSGRKMILIHDVALTALYAQPLRQRLEKAGLQVLTSISIPSGEASKSFHQFEALINEILSLQIDRKTTLLALGGGVMGDLVGFAASVLLRGIPFIQMPTTLLSQIDSSVGGKTGINTPMGKNLVGSFYQPACVLMDSATLASLPAREMKAGYAEMLKYAALGDAAFFDWLEQYGHAVLAQEATALHYAIHHCCAMKAAIVGRDEKESGERALLNLGHTFAHALEAEAGYDGRLLHGEAVGIGLIMAADLSLRLGLCDASVKQRLVAHMQQNGLFWRPADIAVAWDTDRLCSHFIADKKAVNNQLTFILYQQLGKAIIMPKVDPKLARQTVEASLTW